MRIRSTGLAFILLASIIPLPASAGKDDDVDRIRVVDGQLLYEFTGQVTNFTTTTSTQYGYFTTIHGIGALFTGIPAEGTARFTFYREATNVLVVANGPLRTISRVGTTTVYFNASPAASFANPDSFRAGTPIQRSTFEQQVVVDTTSQVFTVVNVETLTEVDDFNLDGIQTAIGGVGDAYRTVKQGRLNSPAPPAGHFGGYSVGVRRAARQHSGIARRGEVYAAPESDGP